MVDFEKLGDDWVQYQIELLERMSPSILIPQGQKVRVIFTEGIFFK